MWRVVLRSPANDVSEEVALDGPASVAELRRIVSSSFPGHPAPETVRLFLSGRLLREGDSVEGTEGEALVVHVVAPAGKVATSTPVARAQAAAVAPVVQEQQQKQHDQEERHPQQQQQPQHEDAVPVLPLPQAPVPPAQNRLRVGLLLRLAALVLLLAQGGDSSRTAALCVAGFVLYVWSARSLALPAVGRAAGGGGWRAELHDLALPLLLSCNPAWRTDAFLGQRAEAPPVEEAEEEEEEEQ